MGQKIQPTGFRLPVTRNWNSRWFAGHKDFARMLNEDVRVRQFLKKKLKTAAVSKVLIERPAKNARITIFSARPGVVIGKKGEDIEALKTKLASMMGVPVHVNIEEIRKPEVDAQLIAESITQQLEKRIMFRRAMKRAMQNAIRLGAQGIKVMSSGRLNGAEIARREWYREGRVPLHTLKADIDYGFAEANTTYGIIGVKVWIYKGELISRNDPVINSQEEVVEEKERKKKPVSRKKVMSKTDVKTSKSGNNSTPEVKNKPTRKTVRRAGVVKDSEEKKAGKSQPNTVKKPQKKTKTSVSEKDSVNSDEGMIKKTSAEKKVSKDSRPAKASDSKIKKASKGEE
ncbi:MAG: 30S ribosomal protein S3 [Betaproteobacteria bacterium TMED156]|nr:MAG: 30S ribosomal protein S3 [Betaproteobacteria bacterium TMED156]